MLSIELPIHQSILKKTYKGFNKNIKHQKLFSTFTIINTIINNRAPVIIDNNCPSNQHICMISEGSCDTDDWSNDAENSALHYSKK